MRSKRVQRQADETPGLGPPNQSSRETDTPAEAGSGGLRSSDTRVSDGGRARRGVLAALWSDTAVVLPAQQAPATRRGGTGGVPVSWGSTQHKVGAERHFRWITANPHVKSAGASGLRPIGNLGL